MSERIIGILGGMGPEATMDLYREITRRTPATRDQEHLRILIDSNPKIPDRTAAILGEGEDPLPAMLASARILQGAGAGILAVPCNAAHHFLPALRAQVSIGVLDMVAEACDYMSASHPSARRAGLLAATGTVVCGLYHRHWAAQGLVILSPSQDEQEYVHWAVQQVKAGRTDPEIAARLGDVARKLCASGAEAIVLGCTELPLIFDPNSVNCPVVNPTAALAQAAVDWALKRRT